MTKSEFLKKLASNLKGLSEAERNDILYDYEEHFTIGMEKGRAEEQIADDLGDPRTIAKLFAANQIVERAGEKMSPAGIGRAIFATAGLGFFNLVVVLLPLVLIIGVLIGLFSASVSMITGGIGGIFTVIFYPVLGFFIEPVSNLFFLFFMSLGTGSLGILFFIANCFIMIFCYNLFVRYLKWNIEVISGKKGKGGLA